MLIERKGSRRDHGPSTTSLRSTLVRWDRDKQCIRMFSIKAKDFRTKAHHDYRVFVSIEEVRDFLDVLARAIAGDSGTKIATSLSPSLTSLLRIASACSQHRDAGRDGT